MRKYNSYPDWGEIIINTIIWLIIILSFWHLFSINPSTNEIWNNGVCTKCDERFVVVKARGAVNWYVCPECDQEVKRFTW